MKNLVLKDIKVQRLIFFMYCPWMIVTSIISLFEYKVEGQNIESFTGNLMMFFVMGILIFPIISMNYIIAKNSSKSGSINMLLRSLPITSKDIVISKIITPIVIFIIYLIPNIIIQVSISYYLGVSNVVNMGVIGISFIIFYTLSVLNFYIELLYPKSTMLSYTRTVPIFIIILGINVFKKFFVSKEELTFILENLNVVLILTSLILILSAMLSSKIILKKFKSTEL
ncbi:ABC-2 transporter permease [Clostridium sardiniense]|uniref:ABC-2 transporter permease n=1 Tax=Clostridium sardiniense TaxID=29369 RepID=UPI003D352D2D